MILSVFSVSKPHSFRTQNMKTLKKEFWKYIFSNFPLIPCSTSNSVLDHWTQVIFTFHVTIERDSKWTAVLQCNNSWVEVGHWLYVSEVGRSRTIRGGYGETVPEHMHRTLVLLSLYSTSFTSWHKVSLCLPWRGRVATSAGSSLVYTKLLRTIRILEFYVPRLGARLHFP